jgi:hypothetical protein
LDKEIKPLFEYNATLLAALSIARSDYMTPLTRQTGAEYAQALLDCYRVDDNGAYLINKES